MSPSTNRFPDACAHMPAFKGLTRVADNVAASTWVHAFKIVALLEAMSWLGLITGMIFKYGPANNPIGVTIFGPIHGAIFISFLITSGFTALAMRWNLKVTVLAMLSSIPPLATMVFELVAVRRGLLNPERASH